MRRLNFHRPNLRPWLRAALVAYLLATVFLVTLHTHHGGAQDQDCAACTMAHTPAAVTTTVVCDSAPVFSGVPLVLPESPAWDFEHGSALRSRAPPLA